MKYYTPYNHKTDPDLYRTYGSSGVTNLNALRMALVRQVYADPSCDDVQDAELDDTTSSPPRNFHLFIDCKNGQRFRLSRADLRRTVTSEQRKSGGWDQETLISNCEESIRRRLNYPQSFRKSMFTTSARQAPGNANWVVDFDFTAENGLASRLPSSATCITTPEGKMDVEIKR